jgi:RNase H-like domain found in reverse transcriptase
MINSEPKNLKRDRIATKNFIKIPNRTLKTRVTTHKLWKEMLLTSDTSQYTLGGLLVKCDYTVERLQKMVETKEDIYSKCELLGFFSQVSNATQQNYPTIEKELMSVIFKI